MHIICTWRLFHFVNIQLNARKMVSASFQCNSDWLLSDKVSPEGIKLKVNNLISEWTGYKNNKERMWKYVYYAVIFLSTLDLLYKFNWTICFSLNTFFLLWNQQFYHCEHIISLMGHPCINMFLLFILQSMYWPPNRDYFTIYNRNIVFLVSSSLLRTHPSQF
jgi:hypothetical protein